MTSDHRTGNWVRNEQIGTIRKESLQTSAWSVWPRAHFLLPDSQVNEYQRSKFILSVMTNGVNSWRRLQGSCKPACSSSYQASQVLLRAQSSAASCSTQTRLQKSPSSCRKSEQQLGCVRDVPGVTYLPPKLPCAHCPCSEEGRIHLKAA